MSKYKIRELELLSGIKAHTIRMWEKRYGILKPERTDTQIRTYDDEDLTSLLNISILNQHGVKISKIAKLTPSELQEEVKKLSIDEQQESAVISLLVNALLDLDEDMFNRVVDSLIRKEGLTATYFNYFLPFLERMGNMWLVGTISPAHEHFVSNLIRSKLIMETSKLNAPSSDKCYVIFALPEEYHDISLLFYNYMLRRNGMNTIYLGQNLPLEALQEVTRVKKIDGIVSSIVSPLSSDVANEAAGAFKNLHLPIYLGGASSGQLLSMNLTNVFDVKSLITVDFITR
jgi:MerR family transcriptional regulator, light-induced transcriptional regulator